MIFFRETLQKNEKTEKSASARILSMLQRSRGFLDSDSFSFSFQIS
jgi:hypothetical protein